REHGQEARPDLIEVRGLTRVRANANLAGRVCREPLAVARLLARVELVAPLPPGRVIGDEVAQLRDDGRRPGNRAQARVDARGELRPDDEKLRERGERHAREPPELARLMVDAVRSEEHTLNSSHVKISYAV